MIGHLLDGTVRLWQRADTVGDLGETTPGWEPLGTYEAAVQRRSGSLADRGPGEVPEGEWICYMDMGPDVEERDLVEVVTGPVLGTFEVKEVYSPRGHHLQLGCDRWEGVLPEVDS